MYLADLAYVIKSLQIPTTDTTAPSSTNAPPSEQPSQTKKVKKPVIPPLRHTVRSGDIGAAGAALCGAQKGVHHVTKNRYQFGVLDGGMCMYISM